MNPNNAINSDVQKHRFARLCTPGMANVRRNNVNIADMYLSFQIAISDSASFLTHWASKYNYPHEQKYTNNIGKPLTSQSFQELFECLRRH